MDKKWIEFGKYFAKKLLENQINNDFGLKIGNKLIDIFSDNQDYDEFDQRSMELVLESIGNKISKSCSVLLNRTIKDQDRQDVVLEIVLKTLTTININHELMAEVRRKEVNLNRKFLDICKNNKEYDEMDEIEREVVNAMLHQSSIILKRSFEELPEFESERVRYVMDYLDLFSSSITSILDELRNIEENDKSSTPERYKAFERNYCKNIITQYSYTQLYGVADINNSLKKYKLSAAYVELQIQIGDDETQPIEVCDLFSNNDKYIWISGDAGSGKTTCLAWLGIQAAKDEEIPGLNNVIPIIIELRSIENFSELSIVEHINKKVMRDSTYKIPEGWLEDCIDNGRILFLIDGFDEIEDNNCEKVFDWIQNIDPENKCYKVFTSRPYVSERPMGVDFIEARLMPMKMTKIKEFIRYWHKAIMIGKDDKTKEKLENDCQNLIDLLKRNMNLRKLATNPLLCAIISALHSKNEGIVPKNKRELYEACCKMLLEGRDQARGINNDEINIYYDIKSRIMSKLAYSMMKDDVSEISIKDVLGHFEKCIVDMNLDIEADKLLSFFIERTGLLQKPDNNHISFVHRSFEEYLCACEMFRTYEWEFIDSILLEDNWRETISILIGLGDKNHANEIVTKTLSKQNQDNKERCILFALEYMSGTIEIDSQYRKTIEYEVSRFIPPDRDGINRLEKLGEVVVPYLCKKDYYYKSDRLNCLETLCEIGTINAVRVAIDYLDEQSPVKEYLFIEQMLEMFDVETLEQELISDLVITTYNKNKTNKMISTPKLMRFSNGVNKDNIDYLEIYGSFNDISFINGFKNLKQCNLKSYSKNTLRIDFSELSKVDLTNIEELSIWASGDLEINRDSLIKFNNLKRIYLYFDEANEDILSFSTFEELNSLDTIDISVRKYNLFDFSGLNRLKAIRRFFMRCYDQTNFLESKQRVNKINGSIITRIERKY